MELNDILQRRFTKSLEKSKDKSVFSLFKWKKVDVELKDYKTGDTIVSLKNLEFPENYSQTACDIIASKYFRKAGIPGTECETSMRQVSHRMVNFWMESLKDEGVLKTEEECSIFYDEIVFALLSQYFSPNSPQWFNTGLFHSYGISGSSNENYYYDEKSKSVKKSKDAYSRTQASACFIVSIRDGLLGPHSISEQYVTETKLFKGGSGTGTNFSNIRGINEKLSGGGVSSGLMSFLKGLDRNAGAIKSGGTTRRAAKMVCLNIDHPEIYDFITWKSKEENKVRDLVKMGYDGGIDGEAYATVSGQNSNNSVCFTDEFMNKVRNLKSDSDSTITLKGRIDETVNKEVKVKDLWNTFNESAHSCADPAPLFLDTFNAWHTCPAGEDGEYNAPHNRINSTNPCGEYAFLDDTSCNLASINVYKFYDENTKTFDLEGYLHLISLAQLVLEGSIHFGQFPTEDIARKTYLFRSTGLGIANLASLLMVMGIPYDSHEGRAIASSLISLLTGRSYVTSGILAKELGPFAKFDINRDYMLRVIKNHSRASGVERSPFENLSYIPQTIDHGQLKNLKLESFSSALYSIWNEAVSLGSEFGFRNAQVSVIAPTGTISFAMDCGSTSIEPFFSHVVYKKLVGGGFLTVVNPILESALKNLGYNKTEIEDITNYILRTETSDIDGYKYERIIDGKIEGAPHLKPEHLKIFDTANKCGTGKRYIDPMGHVKMVAAITPVISGSISKTVNLPGEATTEDFENVVLSSWEMGIKGITLYRDGSKFAQPLNLTLDVNSDETILADLTYEALLNTAKNLITNSTSRRDKPKGIRIGKTHPAQIEDVKIYTTVNRNEDGDITEIYITTDREGTIITGLLNSLSKSISVMLQYHVPAKDISRMLRGQNYEPHGFVNKHPFIKHVSSISDLISKIIDIELGDYSRCQIRPTETTISVKEDKTNEIDLSEEIEETIFSEELLEDEIPFEVETSDNSKKDLSDSERVYGKTCTNCSSTRMVRNGTCYVCLDCGTTTGCS